MKIGIPANVNLLATPNFNLNKANYTSDVFINLLVSHGIVPLVIPVVPKEMITTYLDEVDGVIVPGGNDISPTLFGEQPQDKLGKTYLPHDEFEMQIIKEAIDKCLPVLGICRGHQMINVALGGSLYQDLKTQQQDVQEHMQTVAPSQPVGAVKVVNDSQLAQSVGTKLAVNSLHHQAVKKVAPGLQATAYAADGVVEAIENDDASIMGIQWHPEFLWQNDAAEEQIFLDFFARVAK